MTFPPLRCLRWLLELILNSTDKSLGKPAGHDTRDFVFLSYVEGRGVMSPTPRQGANSSGCLRFFCGRMAQGGVTSIVLYCRLFAAGTILRKMRVPACTVSLTRHPSTHLGRASSVEEESTFVSRACSPPSKSEVERQPSPATNTPRPSSRSRKMSSFILRVLSLLVRRVSNAPQDRSRPGRRGRWRDESLGVDVPDSRYYLIDSRHEEKIITFNASDWRAGIAIATLVSSTEQA